MEKAVILPNRPVYCKLIEDGLKSHELRRRIWKNKDVTRVYLYATAPLSYIRSYFTIGEILEECPSDLWMKVSQAGISWDEFLMYFGGLDKGYAIEVQHYRKLRYPLRISELGLGTPQNFIYIDIVSLEEIDVHKDVNCADCGTRFTSSERWCPYCQCQRVLIREAK